MPPVAPQKGHGLRAVYCYMQTDGRVGIAEGLYCQPDIAETIFDQENIHWRISFAGNSRNLD
jgi:hypothetical protein